MIWINYFQAIPWERVWNVLRISIPISKWRYNSISDWNSELKFFEIVFYILAFKNKWSHLEFKWYFSIWLKRMKMSQKWWSHEWLIKHLKHLGRGWGQIKISSRILWGYEIFSGWYPSQNFPFFAEISSFFDNFRDKLVILRQNLRFRSELRGRATWTSV